MGMYKSYSADVMVNGEGIQAFIEGMGTFKRIGTKMLADHGISNPKAGQWYLLQSWLDAFSEMRETVGKNTLYSIGKRISELARFPPELNSIEKALSSLNAAYHLNHKNGDIGEYVYEPLGPRSCRVVCRNPYPCDFDRGIIESFVFRFKPADSSGAIVQHDQGSCRELGGKTCSFTITW